MGEGDNATAGEKESGRAEPWAPALLGPAPPEMQESSTPSTSTSYPFDLMPNGAEPWRFSAADVHTFHVVTAAVGALLAARALLPSFAIALGLRGASSAPT